MSDTIWWLADPLYVAEGNDRWAEHVDRVIQARLFRELWEGASDLNLASAGYSFSWPDLIGRGPWDSYYLRHRAGEHVNLLLWTGEDGARYHFVPDFEGDGLDNPRWTLDAGVDREGYTPPYGPFYQVPVQIARFRGETRDGEPSLRFAAATRLPDGPLAEADSVHFVLSSGPDIFDLLLSARFTEARASFVAEAPPAAYVASIEVIEQAGVGWHRKRLEPIDLEGPGISDILFYQPHGRSLPADVVAAASTMHPTLTLDEIGEVGLFWEVYGVDAGVPMEFELRVERDQAGAPQRLRRLLPGGSDEATGAVRWTGIAADGAGTATAIIVDGASLGSGRLTFVLRVRSQGRLDLQTRRTVTLR